MKLEHKGLLLRILLNRAHGALSEPILKTLPQEEAEQVKRQTITATDPEPLLTHAKRILPHIHYTWLKEPLLKQEPAFQDGILRCLAENQQKSLAKELGRTFNPSPLNPFFKKFYSSHLYSTFPLLHESLPLAYQEESPLSFLSELSKKSLIELIDKLAMFDLAHEMKKIVATRHLNLLYASLSPDQQEFLRKCLHLKDRMIPSKMHLENLSGKELLLQLHKRGIVRLGIALSGESEELVWLIVHKLDHGRGTLLKKAIKKEAIPVITDAVIQQVQMANKGAA